MLLKAENISEKRKTDPAALHREIKSILVGTGVSDYAGSSLFKNSLPSSKGCGFTLHRCNAGRPAHLLVYPKAAGAQNQLHDKKESVLCARNAFFPPSKARQVPLS